MSEKPAEKAPVELEAAKDLKEKKEKHEEKSARKEKKEIVEDDENGAEEEEDDEDANPEDDEDEDEEDEENEQEPDSHAIKRSAEKSRKRMKWTQRERKQKMAPQLDTVPSAHTSSSPLPICPLTFIPTPVQAPTYVL